MSNPELSLGEPARTATGMKRRASEVRATFASDGWSWIFDLACLGLFCGLAYFAFLGQRGFAKPDEGRYAEIPREMIETGDWVTPRLNGVVYFEKPPLVYWTVAASQVALGREEWVSRLTPALFASMGVLLAYGAGRRLFGRRAGLLGALVLGSSMYYLLLGRLLVLDMVLSVLMAASLFCFILGVRAPPGTARRLLFYGVYASAALATLTKGLIGVLLPGAVMFFWLLLGHQWRRLRPFYLPTGVLLFLAVAAPWHVLIALRQPEWARHYFVHEHWLRFTTTVHDRVQPWWYYLPIVALGLLPWTGFLVPAARFAVARRGAPGGEGAVLGFLVTWAVVVLVFFSASSSKLIPYVLPLFPPLALLTGRWLAEAMDRPRQGAGMVLFAAVAAAAAMGLVAFAQHPGDVLPPATLQAVKPAVYGLAAVLAGGVILTTVGGWRIRPATVVVLAATSVGSGLLLDAVAGQVVPAGTKPLAAVVAEYREPGDRVYHYKDFFHDFTYHARMLVGTVDHVGELELAIDPAARESGRFIDGAELRRQWTEAGRVWLVVRKRNAAALLDDPLFASHVVAESPDHLLFCNRPPSTLSPPNHAPGIATDS